MRVHQSLLDDCGRRMQYKLETPAYYGGSVRALGSAYHKGLEVAYLDRMESGYFPAPSGDLLQVYLQAAHDEFEAICLGTNTSHVSEEGRERGGFVWNSKVPDLDTGHEMLEKMVRAYFENPDAWWGEEWDVIGVEQFFDLPWTMNYTRGGSMDLALYHRPTDTVAVEDHKTAGRRWNTGKEKPRKNTQASWYGWAARELYPGHSNYMVLFDIMTYSGQFERRESNPRPEHINAAAQLLFDTVVNYEVTRANDMDMPANPSSNLCSPEYCDYWSVCPFGEALD